MTSNDGRRDGDGGADAGADDREDGDARATYDAVGDVISYSYLVTNNGNVTLGGPFTVTDDKATVSLSGDADQPGAGGEHHLHGQLHHHARRTWMRAR